MSRKVLVLLLVFVLFAAGCAPAFAAPTTAPDGSPLRRITLVQPRSLECLDDPHFWVASYMGFFAEEGIELIMMPAYGSDVTKMVAEGKADICSPNPASAMSAIAAGIELVSFFQHDVINIFGVSVLEDSPIKTWKDLEGKTIAANNATSYMNVEPCMILSGVDPKTVQYVVAGGQRSVMLAEGAVDAAITWHKEWQNWDAQGIKNRFIAGEDVLKNCANSLCVSPEFYKDNPNILIGIGRALAKGVYFTQCNPLAAAAITVKRFPSLGLTAEQAVSAVAAVPINGTPASGRYGEADLTRWEKCLEWNVYFDAIEEDAIDLASFVKNDLVDDFNKWDKEAVKKLAEEFDVNSVAW